MMEPQPFDINERDVIMTRRVGAQSFPKAGYDREHLNRYFKRLAAADNAEHFTYRNSKSVKSVIDTEVAIPGVTLHEGVGGSISVTTPDGISMAFRRKVETDYIRVVFNLGDFAKNY